MGASWGRLGGVLGRLGGVLGRLGGVLGASWGILERLGGGMKRLEALLKANRPDAENVEKTLVFLVLSSLGRSWKRLRGLLESL